MEAANGSGSSSDSAPDCWDQADLEPGSGPANAAAEEDAPSPASSLDAEEQQLLGAAFSRHLNVNAKPFVPNVHAAEFVPAFLRGSGGSSGAPSSALAPPPSPPPGLPPPPPPPPPPAQPHGEPPRGTSECATHSGLAPTGGREGAAAAPERLAAFGGISRVASSARKEPECRSTLKT